MAAKQGLNRLLGGAKKKVTASEAARGYFFVTNDKLAIATLGDMFNVNFDGTIYKDRHIDSYGRISIARSFLREYRDEELFMIIKNASLVIKREKS